MPSSRSYPSLERVPGKQNWPDHGELVALVQEHGSFTKVAQACGKARESLRDYLRIRPETLAAMEAARPKPKGQARARRDWLARNPEYRRAARRQWMRGKKRSTWATRSYEVLIRYDGCAYCAEPADTTDHVVPRSRGGEDEWTNYTGACRRCNDSKGTDSLLLFLLRG